MSPEEILAQARSAASRAKNNLDRAKKKVRVGFLRKKDKGEIAYAVTEDKDRVKTENAISDSSDRESEDEKPHLHIAVKSNSSSLGSMQSGKEVSADEDSYDVFNNKNRFLIELPTMLKPVEKPVDKVSL